MPFDSNPFAVHHAEGHGALRAIDTTTFDVSTPNDDDFYVSAAGSVTVAPIADRAWFVHFAVTGGAVGDELYMVRPEKIATVSVDANSDTPSAANSIVIRVGAQSIYLSRGTGTHLILASSDVDAVLGSANVVVTIYEMY